MRLGRLIITGVVTLLLGCATAESIEDEGAGGSGATGSGATGSGATGSGATGSGGKADGPGGSGGSAGSGNTSAGGAAGAASGGVSSGGTSSGGSSSGGGGGTGGSCPSGQKKCGGVCIAPSPGIGCSLQDDQCTACPTPPTNSTSICNGALCDYKCNAGYTQSGTSCVSSGGGGAPSGGGGTSGSGGSTGCAAPCNASDITSQFLCTFYCATITGNPGLCAPVLNCCTCPS